MTYKAFFNVYVCLSIRLTLRLGDHSIARPSRDWSCLVLTCFATILITAISVYN